MKFGVTVYPEVLLQVGLHDLDIAVATNAGFSMAGYRTTYSTKPDGKPIKVTALEKV
jgi:hypothetical protein